MQVPGKNVLILAAICLSVVGGVGAYKVAQAARQNASSTVGGIAASTVSINAIQKSDNKLLSALQQTELESISSSTYANPFAPSESDTMTDRLSKNFFTSYAKIQSGESESSSDEATLVNNALATVDVSKMPREKYSTGDMNIISGNTEAELRSYGNNFIIRQNDKLQAIKQNPENYKDNLVAIGTVYASVAQNLIDIPVPVALATEHLTIVNSYYLSSEDFKLINQQTNDPVKALFGLRQYKDAVERQTQMFTDIASHMKVNGIIFSDTEPGYFWNVMNGTAQ